MEFHAELIKGKLIKRYKRFFADIELDNGEVVVAHVPNTGSMLGLKEPMMPCLISPAANPERKLKYTLEMVQTKTSWVGVHTGRPNKLVYEMWEQSCPKDWTQYDRGQLEVKINAQSRLDLVLWDSSKHDDIKKLSAKNIKAPMHFIEIKNVTLGDNGIARFPDAVTERGQKHLEELMKLLEDGFTCEMVYVVQRQDCSSFSPAEDIDPKYAELLKTAVKKGLKVSAFPAEIDKTKIQLCNKSLKIKI